jgi:hypothetical protein
MSVNPVQASRVMSSLVHFSFAYAEWGEGLS